MLEVESLFIEYSGRGAVIQRQQPPTLDTADDWLLKSLRSHAPEA